MSNLFLSLSMFTEAGLMSALALIGAWTAVSATREISRPAKLHEIVLTIAAWLGTVFVAAVAVMLWVLAAAPTVLHW